MSKPRKQTNRFPALSMVDEAFGLLRERWLSFGAPYLVGAVPFYGFLIFYAEDASFGSGDVGRIVLQSTLLAGLFFWMKTWHSYACQDLRNALRGERGVSGGMREFFRICFQQLRLQGYAFWGLVISSILLAPFGWVYAYSQFLSATGIAGDTAKEKRERAWKAAKSLSQPIHLFLVIYAAIWFVVWVNVATLIYFIPELLRMFFGFENIMSQRGWNLFNTTFFVISLSGAAIVSGTLAKAYFTQLLYKSESIRTGHDILSKFSQPSLVKSLTWVAVAFVCVCPIQGNETSGVEDGSLSVTEIELQVMKDSIESALAESEISWRMKRVSKEKDEERGAFRAALEKMVELAKYTGKQIGVFLEWLMGRNDRDALHPTIKGTGGGTDGFLRLLVFLGIAMAVFFVFWLIVAAATRKPIKPKDGATKGDDELELSDESVHAALLPSDRWISLAREKAEAGDYRLAVRAVFLATLALLGSKRLLVLAKHKSNLEYAYELSSRGMANEGRVQFNAFRRAFDRVWYGNYTAAESMYRESMERFQRLDDLSGK